MKTVIIVVIWTSKLYSYMMQQLQVITTLMNVTSEVRVKSLLVSG